MDIVQMLIEWLKPEPLGAEFLKIWDETVEELYEFDEHKSESE